MRANYRYIVVNLLSLGNAGTFNLKVVQICYQLIEPHHYIHYPHLSTKNECIRHIVLTLYLSLIHILDSFVGFLFEPSSQSAKAQQKKYTNKFAMSSVYQP